MKIPQQFFINCRTYWSGMCISFAKIFYNC